MVYFCYASPSKLLQREWGKWGQQAEEKRRLRKIRRKRRREAGDSDEHMAFSGGKRRQGGKSLVQDHGEHLLCRFRSHAGHKTQERTETQELKREVNCSIICDVSEKKTI